MQDILTSIKAYLYERSTSPLTGAFIVAWSLCNYRFFVILFSSNPSHVADKFKAIDALFSPYYLYDGKLVLNGSFMNGFIIPALIALVYLYVYPFLAKPVYEHSLKKQKELKQIKQEQEDQRLLSVKESRELYRRIAQIQEQYETEIDGLNKQISSLNKLIQTDNKSTDNIGNLESEDIDNISLSLDDEEVAKYDEYIAESVGHHRTGTFYLNQLFGQDDWSKIPASIRQALGKRFKAQVERGDFVGVTANGKGSGNQQAYIKRNHY